MFKYFSIKKSTKKKSENSQKKFGIITDSVEIFLKKDAENIFPFDDYF